MIGRPFLDLANKKFGYLTPLYIIDKAKNGTNVWLCQCDCGNTKKVITNNLTNGSTNSCGCLKSKLLRERNKRNNSYILNGEYGIGYTTKNECFYFDLEDYDKIKGYCWSLDTYGYVRCGGKNNKRISMSRFLLDCPDKDVVDHINGIIFDNRKSNLRICSVLKNSWNIKENRYNNTTGKTGVYLDKRDMKYYSRITCNHKVICLGRFDNLEDAIKAREEVEIKYFGEYRRNK